jgi:hypothetical protein
MEFSKFRVVLGLFIPNLVLSGITAFPLQLELEVSTSVRGPGRLLAGNAISRFDHWMPTIRNGLRESYRTWHRMHIGTRGQEKVFFSE